MKNLENEDKKMIYLSHAFGGKQENADKVAHMMVVLHGLFPNYIFISPIHNFGMMYKEVEYVEGLKMCIDLLDKCDECWICGNELSTGVTAELAYCENHLIPYKILGCFDNIPIRRVCWKSNCDIDCLSCEFEDSDDEGLSCWLRNRKVKGETII